MANGARKAQAIGTGRVEQVLLIVLVSINIKSASSICRFSIARKFLPINTSTRF